MDPPGQLLDADHHELRRLERHEANEDVDEMAKVWTRTGVFTRPIRARPTNPVGHARDGAQAARDLVEVDTGIRGRHGHADGLLESARERSCVPGTNDEKLEFSVAGQYLYVQGPVRRSYCQEL